MKKRDKTRIVCIMILLIFLLIFGIITVLEIFTPVIGFILLFGVVITLGIYLTQEKLERYD